ncbi:MAG: hypothetical protein AAF078_01870 [Planctomycetota bacterium]
MFNQQDAKLSASIALPNGAATVNSAVIDIQNSASGDFLAGCEFVIEAPALTVGQLPNSQTMTYSLTQSDDPAFGSSEILSQNTLVQLGADGAGAALAEARFRPPTNVKRYVRLSVTKGGAGDASGVSASLSLRV